MDCNIENIQQYVGFQRNVPINSDEVIAQGRIHMATLNKIINTLRNDGFNVKITTSEDNDEISIDVTRTINEEHSL